MERFRLMMQALEDVDPTLGKDGEKARSLMKVLEFADDVARDVLSERIGIMRRTLQEVEDNLRLGSSGVLQRLRTFQGHSHVLIDGPLKELAKLWYASISLTSKQCTDLRRNASCRLILSPSEMQFRHLSILLRGTQLQHRVVVAIASVLDLLDLERTTSTTSTTSKKSTAKSSKRHQKKKPSYITTRSLASTSTFKSIEPREFRGRRQVTEEQKSILQAWLMNNLDCPYPSDSDRVRLSRETGLPKQQIGTYFTNARSRAWPKMLKERGLKPIRNEYGKLTCMKK